MSVYKRPNSRFWWYAVRQGQGMLRGSTGTENRDVALSVEHSIRMAQKRTTPADRLHAMIDALLGKAADTGLLLAGIWAEYERHLRTSGNDLKPRTLDNRRMSLGRFTRWASENRPACDRAEAVDRAAAAAFADWLAGAGTKGKTRANIIGDLGTIWEGLRRVRDGVTANPWPLVAPNKSDSERGQAFNRGQEAAVLAAADKIGDGWGLACRIARHTGLRYGDVARLPWAAVDLDAGVIRLDPSKTARHGIGVVVPIAPPLAEALQAARLADPFARLVLPVHAASYPRPERKGLHKFADVLEAAGIGEGYTFHSWRHTFRTRLSEAGVSDEIAKRLGGWTEDATAMRYDHDGRSAELRAAVERAAV
jgi:integrase